MTLLCPKCFSERGLKRRIVEIRPNFPQDKCSFHPGYKGVPINEVAEIVDQVFRSNYRFGEYRRYDDTYEGDDLQSAVADLTKAVDDDISIALTKALIENDDYWPPDGGEAFYSDDQSYVQAEPIGHHHSELWYNFCQSIVHRQRFFNANAKELVAEIFDGLHLQSDQHKNTPVYLLSPGEKDATFFRARLASSDAEYRQFFQNPSRELGVPPERKRRPGRMNSAGIATFYGAFDLATCVAELRPNVGAQIVGARFELVRPIYILDTTLFQGPIKSMSLFAKDYIWRVAQWHFMQNFMHEIARPISPNDEYLDYIPTQAVAEYLLHHHEFKRSGSPARIEAIVYRSAQHQGGRNIVLLGDAAQVKPHVEEASKQSKSSSLVDFFPEPMRPFLQDSHEQKYGLQFVEKSTQALRVEGAEFQTHEFNAELNEDF